MHISKIKNSYDPSTKGKLIDYRLYLVTDRSLIGKRNLLQCVAEAIKGGVTLVQLREKAISSLDFFTEALELKKFLDDKNTPLIINDRLDIALAVNAAGVHIGQEDLPARIVREIIGDTMLLGVSATNVDEAVRAQADGADYIGVGAIYPTSTKLDAETVSIEELKRIKKAVTIPVVAIGGITISNAGAILSAGVDGLSIISSILGKEDIESSSEDFIKLFK